VNVHLRPGSRNGQRNGTLGTTALVHEAYLRLVQQDRGWNSRPHFYAVAATAMRHILVDHSRRRQAIKRGGLQQRIPLREAESLHPTPPNQNGTIADNDIELIALDEALSRLALLNSDHAKVIELRYFGGLTIEETAVVLKVSSATVKRHSTLASPALVDGKWYMRTDRHLIAIGQR
jgi:RNA polymerase sigma-70 factor (ECF subfamily)